MIFPTQILGAISHRQLMPSSGPVIIGIDVILLTVKLLVSMSGIKREFRLGVGQRRVLNRHLISARLRTTFRCLQAPTDSHITHAPQKNERPCNQIGVRARSTELVALRLFPVIAI